MSSGQAQKLVLTLAIVGGAIVVYENIRKTGKGSPSGKQIVTYATLLAALAIGAELAPEIAGPLALLIGVSFLVAHIGGTPAPVTGNAAAGGGISFGLVSPPTKSTFP